MKSLLIKSPIKILLAEDNQDHIELIRRSLGVSFPQSKIYPCSTPEECLEILKKKTFDIILLDYYLSDQLGIHLLKKIKIIHPQIPVLIITGQGDERIAAKSIKAGAEDYVVKTRESLEALPTIISQAIQKSRENLLGGGATAQKKRKKNDALLSGVLNEVEEIASTLKSICKRVATSSLKRKNHPVRSDLKKLPLLEKQTQSLKNLMKRLFRGGK